MKLNKKKKGFTIVELVIVIAVIAILSAILIPTFVNLVYKANVSADQSLVKNLNTSLAMEVEDGAKPTMYDTLKVMEEKYGYVVTRLSPTAASNDIVWDAEKNQFVLVMNKEGKYFTGTNSESDYTTYTENDLRYLWKIYNTVADASNSKYSVYLAGNVSDEKIAVNGVGVDVGNNIGLNVEYTNTTGTAREAVIRGNGGDLNFDAPTDTPRLYGEFNTTSKMNSASTSAHVFGKISSIELFGGRLVVEKGCEIGVIRLVNNDVIVAYAPETEEVLVRRDESVTQYRVQTTEANKDSTKVTEHIVKVEEGEAKVYKTNNDGSQGALTTAEEVAVLPEVVKETIETAKEVVTVAQAQAEAADVVAPTFDESVAARIGTTGYATLLEALDNSQNGDKIVLLKDAQFELDNKYIVDKNGYSITKTLTIDGGEDKHSITSGNGLDRVFDISELTTSIAFTLNNVNVVGPTATTYPGGYTRGISFYGNTADVTLYVNNSSISASYYSINVAGGNTGVIKVVANGTSMSAGWCAWQSWSPNAVLEAKDSTFTGTNDKTYNADGWNNFSTFVLNDGSAGSSITLEDCVVEANVVGKAIKSANETNKQTYISFRDKTAATPVTVTNTTFKFNGVAAKSLDEVFSNVSFTSYEAINNMDNNIIIDGETISFSD